MDKIPFEPYDFFGYLASGFTLLVGMQFVFGFPIILAQQQSAIEDLLLLLTAYIVGHVVAMPAKAIFEDLVVGHLLDRPSKNLFENKRPLFRGILFPGYYKPLPKLTQSAILERARTDGKFLEGEDLFLHIRYSTEIKSDPQIVHRLGSFLNQYGFSRNLSFSMLLIAAGLFIKSTMPGSEHLINYCACALVLGLCLFYRYLKFYRQYSYEMFNCYRVARETKQINP